MRKHLVVDPPECTGCDSCMLTCSFEHERSFSLEKARIWMEKDSERADFTPKVCVQCEEAPCIASLTCRSTSVPRDVSYGEIVLSPEGNKGAQLSL